MKKGRHRRFEEARALKRSTDINYDALFEDLNGATSATDDEVGIDDELDPVDDSDDPYDPYANEREEDWIAERERKRGR